MQSNQIEISMIIILEFFGNNDSSPQVMFYRENRKKNPKETWRFLSNIPVLLLCLIS
jgi:hypothetical protein